MEKKLYRLGEVAEITSLSRSELYRRINRGELVVTHIGRAVRVASEDVEGFVRTKRGESRGASVAV